MSQSRFNWLVLALLALAPSLYADDVMLERMKKDRYFLASDECEGRGLKTEGINKAAAYIADQFKAAGLKPAGADGSYFQPFGIKDTYLEAGPHKLLFTGPDGKSVAPAYNNGFT